MDASVHGTGGVLFQDGHPAAYESKSFSSAEYNYPIGQQEMLAVIRALTTWRCFLEGRRFKLVTDHAPLIYFQSQSKLSRMQARWYEYLQQFDFEFVHRPGRINVADPLSRRPDLSASVNALIAAHINVAEPPCPVTRSDRYNLLALTRSRATRASAPTPAPTLEHTTPVVKGPAACPLPDSTGGPAAGNTQSAPVVKGPAACPLPQSKGGPAAGHAEAVHAHSHGSTPNTAELGADGPVRSPRLSLATGGPTPSDATAVQPAHTPTAEPEPIARRIAAAYAADV